MFGDFPQIALLKNEPDQSISHFLVQPLFARQMILRRQFALIRDLFLGRPNVPSLELNTAQSKHSLSFVLSILTAYLPCFLAFCMYMYDRGGGGGHNLHVLGEETSYRAVGGTDRFGYPM